MRIGARLSASAGGEVDPHPVTKSTTVTMIKGRRSRTIFVFMAALETLLDVVTRIYREESLSPAGSSQDSGLGLLIASLLVLRSAARACRDGRGSHAASGAPKSGMAIGAMGFRRSATQRRRSRLATSP